jgi:hypothetical protein
MTAGGEGAPAGRVPDFFIVGHEKSGTTALFKMLRQHPQIFMPEHKEPRFFSSDIRAVKLRREGGENPRTLEQYLALFADAPVDLRAGEASPQYIRSPGAAGRIAEFQPNARIIAILREPASFLQSIHLARVQSALEPERDMRKALALEDERRLGRRLPPDADSPAWLLYSDHVRYVEQLRRYQAVFPPEQMLVLIYEDYRSDNRATLRQVLDFLDVDSTIEIEPIEARKERLTAVRLMPLHRISRRLRLARHRPEQVGSVARTVSRLTPDSAQRLWRRAVYKPPSSPDPALTLELRKRFKPEVEALSEYLGRDLVSLWGYEAL